MKIVKLTEIFIVTNGTYTILQGVTLVSIIFYIHGHIIILFKL